MNKLNIKKLFTWLILADPIHYFWIMLPIIWIIKPSSFNKNVCRFLVISKSILFITLMLAFHWSPDINVINHFFVLHGSPDFSFGGEYLSWQTHFLKETNGIDISEINSLFITFFVIHTILFLNLFVNEKYQSKVFMFFATAYPFSWFPSMFLWINNDTESNKFWQFIKTTKPAFIFFLFLYLYIDIELNNGIAQLFISLHLFLSFYYSLKILLKDKFSSVLENLYIAYKNKEKNQNVTWLATILVSIPFMGLWIPLLIYWGFKPERLQKSVIKYLLVSKSIFLIIIMFFLTIMDHLNFVRNEMPNFHKFIASNRVDLIALYYVVPSVYILGFVFLIYSKYKKNDLFEK